MDYEKIAKQRVSENPELTQHEDIIFYDWSNWDEHMEWIATAPIEKIVSWANSVVSYSKQHAAHTLGSIKTDRKAQSSAENGSAPVKPGSNPRGRPRKNK